MNLKHKILEFLGLEYSYPTIKKELKTFSLSNNKSNPNFKGKIDVIIPSFNRVRELKRTINNLQNNSKLRIIVVDNDSNNTTKNYLKSLSSPSLKVVFQTQNTGGSGARIEGLKHIDSEFVAFLDNDIITFPGYFENLIFTLETHSEVIAAQSKVILPNGLIQINRPHFVIEDKWIIFGDKDRDKKYNDYSSIVQEECNYTPIGATLWRSKIFQKYNFDIKFKTVYEDNDFSYSLNKEGFKFINCPNAICLHIPSNFAPDSTRQYEIARFDNSTILNSAKEFYKKHGKYFAYNDISSHIKYIGFNSTDEYINFLKS